MANQFLPGDYLGKYKIEERLGRGGMAEVFKAFHANLNRHVAIKIMHAYLADDENFLTRFRREAHAMAAIEHPNIVRVYDFEAEDDYYYIVMEYLSGGTLKDRIDRNYTGEQVLPLSLALRYVLEMADALSFAHSRSMIHRDIKPANIMFNERGAAVLTDFGIAKMLTATSSSTSTGAMIGTPAYMSPEQGLGEPGDERSDIYSLGVLAYHLFTGRLPHEGDTPLSVVLKHVNDTPIRPTLINSNLTSDFENIILKAMAKNPGKRYQKASEMARDLRRIIKYSDILGVDDIEFPTQLLEDQPTPLPGKTLSPVSSPMSTIEDDPGLMEFYKNLPTPPPANKVEEPETPPTLLGEQPYEYSSNGRIDSTHVATGPIEFDRIELDDVPAADLSEPVEVVSEQPALVAESDQAAEEGVVSEISQTLKRLSDNSAPITSAGRQQRVQKRKEEIRKKKLSRQAHVMASVFAVICGLAIGFVTFNLYFTPDQTGESAVQRFNQWLNQRTGGQTAEDVDLSQIEFENNSRPAVSGAAIILELTDFPAEGKNWGTIVQRQTEDGSWADIGSWQSAPDTNGFISWQITPTETDNSLYRWVVYPPDAGDPIAVSDPFNLPQTADEQIEIVLAVANP